MVRTFLAMLEIQEASFQASAPEAVAERVVEKRRPA